MYSDYCNNHAHAIKKLQFLKQTSAIYQQFFEVRSPVCYISYAYAPRLLVNFNLFCFILLFPNFVIFIFGPANHGQFTLLKSVKRVCLVATASQWLILR